MAKIIRDNYVGSTEYNAGLAQRCILDKQKGTLRTELNIATPNYPNSYALFINSQANKIIINDYLRTTQLKLHIE